MNPKVQIKILKEGVTLPVRQTEGSAGFDLASAVTVELPPGEVILVPTGLCFSIPLGMEGEVRPRSGFSTKNKILIPNAPGTIDSDYRGEVFVPLLNLDKKPFSLGKGMRIAQILFKPVLLPELELVPELGETARGDKGFGSTG